MRAFLLAVAVAACASSPSAAPVTADPVIAAERAFAARAGEIAWIPAFREFVAPDGQLAGPIDYVDAPAQLAASQDDGERNLFWWPAFAGIARSGDLGFTTGAVSFDEARTPRGHYFTVWRRQPDGSWKWIYDGGVGPIAEPNLIAPDAAHVPQAPTSAAGVGADAAAQVRVLDAGSIASRLAPDAQAFRTRYARAVGPNASSAFAIPGGEVRYVIDRVEASLAGDLVMVLGRAMWTAEGQPAQGLYARMWQYRPDGWRVIYDQLVLPRPPPAG